MSLPPRQAKKAKRSTRWRSQAHLSYVRSFQCALPGCVGLPIEAAHVRLGSGAGLGQKPSDWRAVPLCKDHHSQQHTIGERSFWQTYQLATGQDVDALIDGLCKDSPRAMQIRIERKG